MMIQETARNTSAACATKQPVPSFLRWVGSKRELLPKLRELRPAEFGNYFEPFLGGGSHFLDLGLDGSKAFLSDGNADLILAWRTVRDDLHALIEHLDRLAALPYEADSYLEIRQQYNERAHVSAVERAAWFIYLNKVNFNGVYRVNLSGLYNVPFGKSATGERPALYGRETIAAVSRALQWTELHCADFRLNEVRGRVPRAGDFVYFDSPYDVPEGAAGFTSYTNTGFGRPAQRDLARTFMNLAERGVQVLASNSDTPLIRELYDGFPIVEVSRSGSVSCKTEKRQRVGELIIRSHKWATVQRAAGMRSQ